MTSGNGHIELLTFAQPPERVVSLVPSMTDTLVEFGLAERIVGVTDYCPKIEGVEETPLRLGGTKNPDVEAIVELSPDLVIVSQEENERNSVEELERAGLKVWITFPRSVHDTLSILSALANLFQLPGALPRIQMLEQSVSWARRAHYMEERLAFVPVWQGQHNRYGRWWMTFNSDTYAHDILRHCGALNVFGERERRYPLGADLGKQPAQPAGERDTRYPRVTVDEVVSAQPQLILLPDEPFPFDVDMLELVVEELAETPAVQAKRVHLVDGSLITWPGTRMGAALAELPGIIAGDLG